MATMIHTFAPASAAARPAAFAPATGWPRRVAPPRPSLDAGRVISGIALGLAYTLPLAWVASL